MEPVEELSTTDEVIPGAQHSTWAWVWDAARQRQVPTRTHPPRAELVFMAGCKGWDNAKADGTFRRSRRYNEQNVQCFSIIPDDDPLMRIKVIWLPEFSTPDENWN
ncbi:MAG: hypothetical protein EOO38_05545 [Cytophagaceae bacterium]|nr:MAG: hypothetical protein EOO38_05545 [Cytophagaceae bacterium]